MFPRRPGGNYTEDRKAIYDDMTMEEIIRGVNEFLLENPIEKLFHKRLIIYDDMTTEGEIPGADGIPEDGSEEPYRRLLHVHGYLPSRDVPKEDLSPQ